MAECTFVILGATGDLTKRKILPAIYHLVKHKKLLKFAIVGVSRSQKTGKQLLSAAKPFIKDYDAKTFKKLERATYYQPFDFYDKKGYEELCVRLGSVEKTHQLKGNRLFYLSTLPEHFDPITHHIAKCGIAKAKGWARVVYEKPFGHDLKSAKKMNRCISRVFKENRCIGSIIISAKRLWAISRCCGSRIEC